MKQIIKFLGALGILILILASTGCEVETIEYTLTVTTSGSGTVSPSGGTYDEGTSVTLTATPASGWEFAGWSGDASGTGTTTQVTMNSDKNVVATFTKSATTTQYTLTVSTSGSGSVSPTGGTYDAGTTVTLYATPASGWTFSGWSGSVSGTNTSIQVTMNSDKNVLATFTKSTSTQYTLTVSTSGNGSVSPTGGAYDAGTTVTLYATPDSGWEFSQWSGDASGTSTTIRVTMDSDKSVTAVFSEIAVNNGTFTGTYTILAKHSGKALDCWEWGTGDGTNIVQYDAWEGNSQKFNIEPVDGIWHRITPVIAMDQSLEVADASTEDGGNIQTYNYWENTCQQWRFEDVGNGAYRIINRNSERCTDVTDASLEDGANVMQYTCLSDAENQMFEIEQTDFTVEGTYSIESTLSGKALDVWEWGTGDATNIVQYDAWGSESQLFNIKPVDGAWHRITPVISAAQSLEVADGSVEQGANIHTWSYWGHATQQFRFQYAGSGSWKIINRNSTMCMDVHNSSLQNEANIMQYDCLDGAENQKFKFVQAAGGNRIQADNPIIKQYRSADPSPVVHDGRYYVVFGEDLVDTRAFNMFAWHLVSSDDMIHWTDHGIIARPSDYGWMADDRAWASCIIYRNGYFYFYAGNEYTIGVLRSRDITGPYVDAIGGPLIDQSTPNNTPNPDARDIDPMCFIDDDGQAYLFWGGDGICKYAKLARSMTRLTSSVMDVTGLTGNGYSYLEAPFVIKENGTYFLMYADQPWPSEIRYATSSSIAGPWTHRGVIGSPTGNGTNHEGAAYFNGQWWYTYHTEELSGGNEFSRSVCVDPMTISGSTISRVNYSSYY